MSTEKPPSSMSTEKLPSSFVSSARGDPNMNVHVGNSA
jgi:hypothetical protein